MSLIRWSGGTVEYNLPNFNQDEGETFLSSRLKLFLLGWGRGRGGEEATMEKGKGEGEGEGRQSNRNRGRGRWIGIDNGGSSIGNKRKRVANKGTSRKNRTTAVGSRARMGANRRKRVQRRSKHSNGHRPLTGPYLSEWIYLMERRVLYCCRDPAGAWYATFFLPLSLRERPPKTFQKCRVSSAPAEQTMWVTGDIDMHKMRLVWPVKSAIFCIRG